MLLCLKYSVSYLFSMGESSDLTATMQNIGMALRELRPALVPTKLYSSTYLVLLYYTNLLTAVENCFSL
jgi:hypothetical protein